MNKWESFRHVLSPPQMLSMFNQFVPRHRKFVNKTKIMEKILFMPIRVRLRISHLILIRRSLSYRNQPIDLLCKSMEWFLYDRDLRHKRINDKICEICEAKFGYSKWILFFFTEKTENLYGFVFWCFFFLLLTGNKLVKPIKT